MNILYQYGFLPNVPQVTVSITGSSSDALVVIDDIEYQNSATLDVPIGTIIKCTTYPFGAIYLGNENVALWENNVVSYSFEAQSDTIIQLNGALIYITL